MPTPKEKPEQWTQTTLRSRGWTLSLIKNFIDPPDAIVPNPHYRSAGAPMKLYNATRVQALESTDAIRDKMAQAHQRSLRAQECAAQQYTATLEAVRSWNIVIPLIKPKALIAQAVVHYNDLWESRRREDKWASPHNDPAFLNRIVVNYLRHACSSYEEDLDHLYGKVGAIDARPLLKCRILAAIADAYPDLDSECQKQKHRLTEENDYSNY